MEFYRNIDLDNYKDNEIIAEIVEKLKYSFSYFISHYIRVNMEHKKNKKWLKNIIKAKQEDLFECK